MEWPSLAGRALTGKCSGRWRCRRGSYKAISSELREYAKTKRTLKQTPVPSDLSDSEREVALANAALLTHADGEQSAPEKKALAEFAKLLGFSMDAAKPIIQSARQRAQALASKI